MKHYYLIKDTDGEIEPLAVVTENFHDDIPQLRNHLSSGISSDISKLFTSYSLRSFTVETDNGIDIHIAFDVNVKEGEEARGGILEINTNICGTRSTYYLKQGGTKMIRPSDDYKIYKKIADDNKESLLTKLTIRLNSLGSDAHAFESAMGDILIPDDVDTDEDLLEFINTLGDTRKEAWLNLIESFADVYIYSRAFMEKAGIDEALVGTKVYELLDNIKEKDMKELYNFDPKIAYGGRPEGTFKVLTKKAMQKEAGVISNLIKDMTLKGASDDEIARVIKHSMVVMDAVQYKLDYKASERDNGIKELRHKYQGYLYGIKEENANKI